MKLPFKKASIITLACATALVGNSVYAESAKSQRQAENATKNRKAVFSLLGANMGPLGAMAKGKIPLNAEVVEKNAIRIQQLSLMIVDHSKLDTSAYKVKTSALNDVWLKPDDFSKKANNLTVAADALAKVAATGNEGDIKKAIGNVGKNCGGCHDDFKTK